ncbi:glycosyltransferase family 4 protein [Vibrio breoganii]|uniref:glycosyltransferase family 4 protein n=1 Tax=Vibrio breoganii TaxID=553239 RepID=UPI0018E4BF27|nr:glycosyltransferase [Vibrio breoganii]
MYSLVSKNSNQRNNKNLFKCFYPYRISMILGLIWGVLKCDVIYYPRLELITLVHILCFLFKKKKFRTIEVVIDSDIEKRLSRAQFSKYIRNLKSESNLFSITKHMANVNMENYSVDSRNEILYLGVENTEVTKNCKKIDKDKTNVLLVGHDLVRKGIFDILTLAKMFDNVQFLVVGSGNGRIDIQEKINELDLRNVNYLGALSNNEVNILFSKVDLNILPSRSEGFPKSILEAATYGVPTMTYSDYGAEEWITSNRNGFVVETVDDMAKIIRLITTREIVLDAMYEDTRNLALEFDWKIRVNTWENVIKNLKK